MIAMLGLRSLSDFVGNIQHQNSYTATLISTVNKVKKLQSETHNLTA